MNDLIKCHTHSSNNRDELMASELCGCFYCENIYTPDTITHWIDNQQTATCPNCMIDSVIGTKSGYPITSEFLKEMYKRWFDRFLTD